MTAWHEAQTILSAGAEGPPYAGIGSRGTPLPVCRSMVEVGQQLGELGYILRSGGADGADESFEAGADSVWGGGVKEIFLPWENFNGSLSRLYPPSASAFELAARFHPVWEKLGQPARALHARNCHQILGLDLRSPVAFVLCWTQGGKGGGGTGQALRIAKHYDIPTIDMFFRDWNHKLAEQIERNRTRQ